MIIKDCLGNEILRYYGAYTHYNTISQPFTYSIAKVVIFYKEEWKNGILDIDYKYEYRLYAYHGLTFDCYESGFLVASVDGDMNEEDAESSLRSKAMKSGQLKDWEKRAIERDFVLYGF